MDWALAIERHRKPLLRIVAALYALIGLGEGGFVERLARRDYRAVLDVLRPAESAVRRLIVVAARGLVVKPPAPRGIASKPVVARKGGVRVSFQLFDPLGHRQGSARSTYTRARGPGPRIRIIDIDPRIPLLYQPAPPEPQPDDSVSATRLCRRLAAIKLALEDLPRQARRYARWRARPVAERRPKRDEILRPGPPPGQRRKARHEVQTTLSECSWLAHMALNADTS